MNERLNWRPTAFWANVVLAVCLAVLYGMRSGSKVSQNQAESERRETASPQTATTHRQHTSLQGSPDTAEGRKPEYVYEGGLLRVPGHKVHTLECPTLEFNTPKFTIDPRFSEAFSLSPVTTARAEAELDNFWEDWAETERSYARIEKRENDDTELVVDPSSTLWDAKRTALLKRLTEIVGRDGAALVVHNLRQSRLFEFAGRSFVLYATPGRSVSLLHIEQVSESGERVPVGSLSLDGVRDIPALARRFSKLVDVEPLQQFFRRDAGVK
jgi:hypothetical protein